MGIPEKDLSFEKKNKIVGPMKRLGFLYQDEKGFMYFEDGRILDVGFHSWNASPTPEKDLIGLI